MTFVLFECPYRYSFAQSDFFFEIIQSSLSFLGNLRRFFERIVHDNKLFAWSSSNFLCKIYVFSELESLVAWIVVSICFLQKKRPDIDRAFVLDMHVKKSWFVLTLFGLKNRYVIIYYDVFPYIILEYFDQVNAIRTHILILKHLLQ